MGKRPWRERNRETAITVADLREFELEIQQAVAEAFQRQADDWNAMRAAELPERQGTAFLVARHAETLQSLAACVDNNILPRITALYDRTPRGRYLRLARRVSVWRYRVRLAFTRGRDVERD